MFDYLDDRTARALLRAMFECLRPGGRLLIANFTRAHQGRGYMTFMMDWVLVRRDAADLVALSNDIGDASLALSSSWTDAGGNIAYLEIERL